MRTFVTLRRSALVAVALVGALGLTGCSGEAPAEDSPNTPVVVASGQACKLVTLSEAKDAIGGELSVATDEADGCTYTTQDGLKSVDLKVEQMAYDTNQVTQVKSMLEPSGVKELSGIGDAAFAYQPTENLTQIYIWGKGRFLEVFVGNSDGKTADVAKQLAEKAYSRL